MVSKAVLLARGEGGDRDGSNGQLGPARPYASHPSLLPLANRPLVLHAVDALDRAGITDLAIVAQATIAAEVQAAIGEGADWGLRMTWFEQDPGDGFGTTLSLVRDFVDEDPFVLHLGDSLCKQSLRPLIDSAPIGRLDALVLVRETPGGADVFDLALERRAGEPGRPRLFASVEPAGVCVFGAQSVEVARQSCRGATSELEVTVTLEQMAALGGQLQLRPVDEWWRYRRQTDVMLEGNRFVLEGLTAQTEGAQLVNTPIQGGVVVHPSARLRSSVVRGPAIIGAGAELTDAYVGPYTSIAEDVTIEAAEIEDSIILAGSTINHMAGRIESSIVGPRAHVFRDFRLPKALRLNLGESAEVSLP